MIAPDTSALIASLIPWHWAHGAARRELRRGDVRLPAHAAFETVSVLSRMPEDRRIAAGVVLEALQNDYPEPWLALTGRRLRYQTAKARPGDQ